MNSSADQSARYLALRVAHACLWEIRAWPHLAPWYRLVLRLALREALEPGSVLAAKGG